MEIQQSEEYKGDNWWQWSVWLDGPDAELDEVESVEWQLHPSFPHPIRRTTERQSRFRLETGGWGVFPILATVRFKSGVIHHLRHHLQLHFPDGRENTA